MGHGLGLGANGKKYGKSLCTDDEYIFNSSQSKINKKNKVGVFCFPSIATFKQIKSAKINGLDFIGGVDLNDINKSKKIIEYSKELDLKVFANLVKTYSY